MARNLFSAIFLIIFVIPVFCKPRLIQGTVYAANGKKASGVIVTADRSRNKYYTSFDGFYEIKAKTNSKWLKFKFPDKEEIMNIEGIERDVIDFRVKMPEKSSAGNLQSEKNH